MSQEDFEQATYFQNLLISVATGGDCEEKDYLSIRKSLLATPKTKKLLPSFLKTNRDCSQFWQFIKHEFPTYKERRDFIYQKFSPLLDFLESNTQSPADSTITQSLIDFDLEEENIHLIWLKALERKNEDPEGAITSARTLLETVCKHILDKKMINYKKNIDLHQLYKMTATELNLSASQHNEDIFKQILGGCSAVVNGLGNLRNQLGDAHGKGLKATKPLPRHATLAVNLSGSLAMFLVSTYIAQKDT